MPSTAINMSPGLIPAAADGEPGVTAVTSTPPGRSRPSCTALAVVSASPSAPIQPVTSLPVFPAPMKTRTMFDGIAKPTPFEPPDGDAIAVLMPSRRPPMSSNAPPELPGLIAASVWMIISRYVVDAQLIAVRAMRR